MRFLRSVGKFLEHFACIGKKIWYALAMKLPRVALAFVWLLGCSSAPSGVIDGGGGKDASAPDAPVVGDDAGSADEPEAGPPPRADVPSIPCTDTLADVYVTPTNLPPMTHATRGDVVRCALDFSLRRRPCRLRSTARASRRR